MSIISQQRKILLHNLISIQKYISPPYCHQRPNEERDAGNQEIKMKRVIAGRETETEKLNKETRLEYGKHQNEEKGEKGRE